MILGLCVNDAQFPTSLTKYIVPRPHCLTLNPLCWAMWWRWMDNVGGNGWAMWGRCGGDVGNMFIDFYIDYDIGISHIGKSMTFNDT